MGFATRLLASRVTAVDLDYYSPSDSLNHIFDRYIDDIKEALVSKKSKPTRDKNFRIVEIDTRNSRYLFLIDYSDKGRLGIDGKSGVPAGYVTLDRIPDEPKMFTPHSQFKPDLQGKGWGTSIYTKLLKSGLVLISSDVQSPGANLLWKSLARTHEWFLIDWDPYRNDPPKYLEQGANLSRAELLSKRTLIVLLGKGWDLLKFSHKMDMIIPRN